MNRRLRGWLISRVGSEGFRFLARIHEHQEILGFHAVRTGPGPGTVDGFFALAIWREWLGYPRVIKHSNWTSTLCS